MIGTAEREILKQLQLAEFLMNIANSYVGHAFALSANAVKKPLATRVKQMSAAQLAAQSNRFAELWQVL